MSARPVTGIMVDGGIDRCVVAEMVRLAASGAGVLQPEESCDLLAKARLGFRRVLDLYFRPRKASVHEKVLQEESVEIVGHLCCPFSRSTPAGESVYNSSTTWRGGGRA